MGAAAVAAAEVRRNRRRLSMGATSVLGKFASEAICACRRYFMNVGVIGFAAILSGDLVASAMTRGMLRERIFFGEQEMMQRRWQR